MIQMAVGLQQVKDNLKNQPLSNALSQCFGYAKGFPWGLLPVAAYSAVKAKVSPNKEDDRNTEVLLEMMKQGADQFCCLIWQARGFYSAADPYVPAKYFQVNDPEFPKTKATSIDLDGLKL